MNYDASQLLSMSQTQLDDLFRASPPGDIPNGSATGTAIIAPGTVYSSSIAEMINLFGWQGKAAMESWRAPRPPDSRQVSRAARASRMTSRASASPRRPSRPHAPAFPEASPNRRGTCRR